MGRWQRVAGVAGHEPVVINQLADDRRRRMVSVTPLEREPVETYVVSLTMTITASATQAHLLAERMLEAPDEVFES